jgi:hypothetical protein
MKQSDGFDSILDEALSVYRDAEPLAGLEDRVLQRRQRQREQRRTLWWRSAFAAATMSVLTIAWLALHPYGKSPARHEQATASRREPLQAESSRASANLPAAPVRSQYGSAQPAHQARNVTPNTAPRMMPAEERSAIATPSDTPFPSPSPLTPQERSLLAIAKADPHVLQNRSATISELTIAPIDIQPLANEASGRKGNE